MIYFGIRTIFFDTLKTTVRQFNKMDSQRIYGVKKGWPLSNVINKLESFAPLATAEKWDNVGLLIEPYQQKESIKTIFLTNDLTLDVMEEAVEKNADLVISYHPPLFAPLKRITQDNWKAKIVSICLAKGIAVYSPHTTWDSHSEGVNDWLSKAFPPNDNAKPIKMDPITKTGPGLIWSYSPGINLGKSIEGVQKYIGVPVHVAMGVGHTLDSTINTVSCCAGSGASLLKEVATTDVFLTGEMSHHELLDAQHRNITVLLCNHSNTERGFLKDFKPKLNTMLQSQCDIVVSECDKDPLTTFFNNK